MLELKQLKCFSVLVVNNSKMNFSIISICSLSAFLSFFSIKTSFEKSTNQTTAITVTIKDIKTAKGQILMGIFKDDVSFEKETPYKKVQSFKTKISNGRLQVEVKLEPGKYGISLVDDENFNGKMDFNFLGIPKEGFGFSNYYHTGLTKPKLSLFEFEVFENKSVKIEVPMKYM